MPNMKRAGRTEPEPLDIDFAAEPVDEDAEGYEAFESFDIHHANCPDCGQSIALVADEEFLPEHALCPSPWNPFGLTVCPGTGRPAAEAQPAGQLEDARELEPVVMLSLPQGLDWRTQPFSHVGGPGSRPVRMVLPQMRQHVQAA
ncbi:hypothetical protein [Streptomyces sp. NPDC089919]|uniref:hypothetical protein n=1 Tax=Streptomyces sp. NPDC089919 TaxID=3155188 RepID=UPI0034487491